MLESKQSSSMAKRKLTYKIESVCEVNLVNIFLLPTDGRVRMIGIWKQLSNKKKILVFQGMVNCFHHNSNVAFVSEKSFQTFLMLNYLSSSFVIRRHWTKDWELRQSIERRRELNSIAGSDVIYGDWRCCCCCCEFIEYLMQFAGSCCRPAIINHHLKSRPSMQTSSFEEYQSRQIYSNCGSGTTNWN